MAEDSNLRSKARDIMISPSHEGLATVIKQLFTRQESEESKQARALYDFFVSDLPNCLTLKLLKLYQSSPDGVLRFQSIYQLSETLADLRIHSVRLSLDILYEIKPLLISCLTMEESDIKILRRIVSFVAYNVMVLHNGKWDELSDCMFSLVDKEPLKAFHVFIDLPPVYKSFTDKFMHKILEKAGNVFVSTKDEDSVEDWSLGLKTIVKMGVMLVDSGMRFELINFLMDIKLSFVLTSVIVLVKKRMEEFLVRGLEDFERFLSRDMNLYDYSKEQCDFVLAFVKKIERVGTQSKEVVRKIKMLVTTQDDLAIKPQDDVKKKYRVDFGRSWLDYLKTLSLLEVMRICALSDLEDRFREMAIRRVNVLLSEHKSKKVLLDDSVFTELQPLLISCLKEGVSDSMFKVLGEVVNHVALEIFVYQDQKWYELRDYIVSQSKTEFQRAVYIFQCLTMALIDDDFVNSVTENLLPEISIRLNPPTELLFDNSGWVLAYTGSFCTIIHLLEMPYHGEYVEEIAHKMVDSVRQLVERGMEVGLVRRAFRDVETIVKKQLEWYGANEYKFLKGLLWRLYAIKGMKGESKIVLWRINVIVERGLKTMVKQLPKNDELDWLNVRDDEDDEEGNNE